MIFRKASHNDLRTKRSLIYFINNIGSTFKTLLFVIKIINISRREKQQVLVRFSFYFGVHIIQCHINGISMLFRVLRADSSTNSSRCGPNPFESVPCHFRTFPVLLYGEACAILFQLVGIFGASPPKNRSYHLPFGQCCRLLCSGDYIAHF